MDKKALKSLEAARRLVETRESYGYNSSIHCSYYAVLQYMKYALAKCKINPLSYEKQSERKNGSSHEFILNEVKNRIDNIRNAKKFTETIRNLKRLRVEADYTQRNFSEEESLYCKEQAECVIKKLKQHLI